MINYDNLTSQMNDKSIQKLNEANATQRRNEQAILLRTAVYASSSSVFRQKLAEMSNDAHSGSSNTSQICQTEHATSNESCTSQIKFSMQSSFQCNFVCHVDPCTESKSVQRGISIGHTPFHDLHETVLSHARLSARVLKLSGPK